MKAPARLSCTFLTLVLCVGCSRGHREEPLRGYLEEPLRGSHRLTWYMDARYFLDNVIMGPGNLALEEIKELNWAPGALLQIDVPDPDAEHLIPNTESDFIRALLEKGVRIEFVHHDEPMQVRFIVVRADKGKRLQPDRSCGPPSSGVDDPGDPEAWTYFLDGRFLGEGPRGIAALKVAEFREGERLLVIYPWVNTPASPPFQHEVPLRPVIDQWRKQGIRVECLAEEWPRI